MIKFVGRRSTPLPVVVLVLDAPAPTGPFDRLQRAGLTRIDAPDIKPELCPGEPYGTDNARNARMAFPAVPWHGSIVDAGTTKGRHPTAPALRLSDQLQSRVYAR